MRLGPPHTGHKAGAGSQCQCLLSLDDWRVESGEWCNGDLRVTGSGETRQWPGHWAPSPPSGHTHRCVHRHGARSSGLSQGIMRSQGQHTPVSHWPHRVIPALLASIARTSALQSTTHCSTRKSANFKIQFQSICGILLRGSHDEK